jgi:hypothetical protein
MCTHCSCNIFTFKAFVLLLHALVILQPLLLLLLLLLLLFKYSVRFSEHPDPASCELESP